MWLLYATAMSTSQLIPLTVSSMCRCADSEQTLRHSKWWPGNALGSESTSKLKPSPSPSPRPSPSPARECRIQILCLAGPDCARQIFFIYLFIYPWNSSTGPGYCFFFFVATFGLAWHWMTDTASVRLNLQRLLMLWSIESTQAKAVGPAPCAGG